MATDSRNGIYALAAKQDFPKWLAALAGVAAVCALSISLTDKNIALRSAHSRWDDVLHRYAVGAEPILGLLIAAAMIGYVASWRSKKLSFARDTLLLAAISACMAFAINDFILKKLFGRQTPDEDYLGFGGFHLFGGDLHASFPSGHTVIAASVLSVLWRRYPNWRATSAALLVLFSAALVLGHLHFLSDVIAGAFVGASIGFMATEIWQWRHAPQ
jgi:membrane-associated phospholipid phosphatase